MICLWFFHRRIHKSIRRGLGIAEPYDEMMKKLLCGILAALMLLSSVACTGGDTTDTEGDTTVAPPATEAPTDPPTEAPTEPETDPEPETEPPIEIEVPA